MPGSFPDLRRNVAHLPEAVTAALKAQARIVAEQVKVRAAELLNSKTHGTGKTAAAIRVLDETDRKQWVVNSPGDPSRPANLPMWLEYGTRFMSARAYMRPAADEADATYRQVMTKAAEDAVKRTLTF